MIYEIKKLQAVTVMLKADALYFFPENKDRGTTYEVSFELLRTWYHSDEQRLRVLAECQELRLSEEMARSPDMSEQAVLRNFVARLRTLQKQPDKNYEGDGYLVECLLTSGYIPVIQAALKTRCEDGHSMRSTYYQIVSAISRELPV